MLHPQHIRFVVFGHMVQRLVSSNGIRHGSSWYLASGRIAFAFSSQYRLIKFHPIFMCLPNVGAFFYETVSVDSASWRVFPTFRSRRVELLVCRIWRTCALSPVFPSICDFSMQCTSWRYQMNQKSKTDLNKVKNIRGKVEDLVPSFVSCVFYNPSVHKRIADCEYLHCCGCRDSIWLLRWLCKYVCRDKSSFSCSIFAHKYLPQGWHRNRYRQKEQ